MQMQFGHVVAGALAVELRGGCFRRVVGGMEGGEGRKGAAPTDAADDESLMGNMAG